MRSRLFGGSRFATKTMRSLPPFLAAEGTRRASMCNSTLKPTGGSQRAPADLFPAPVMMSSLLAYFGAAEGITSPCQPPIRGLDFSSAFRSRALSGCGLLGGSVVGVTVLALQMHVHACSSHQLFPYTKRLRCKSRDDKILVSRDRSATSTLHSPQVRPKPSKLPHHVRRACTGKQKATNTVR